MVGSVYGGLVQESLELVYVTSAIGGCMVLQSLGAGSNGCHEFVHGGEARAGDVFVAKLYSVAEAFAVGGLDMASVCAVVLRRCAEVPAVDGMEGQRAAGVRFLVYLDSTPHWRKWHLVVVEGSIQVGICRN